MKGEGKTFHHSTTGKTLSNQERLNMIKISSPSPCMFSGRQKFFHLRKPPKISQERKREICRDLSLSVENRLMKMNVNLVSRISIIYAARAEKLISMRRRLFAEASSVEYD